MWDASPDLARSPCVMEMGVVVAVSDTGYLLLLMALEPFVVVSFMIHDRNFREVLRERRRLRLPLEAGGLPGIVPGDFPVLKRPGQVENGQQIPHAQHRGPGRRKDVQHLKLRRVGGVTARHAESAQNELREEGQI